MNKFEQVSSDGHQMSLAGGQGPISDVQGGVSMSDVQGRSEAGDGLESGLVGDPHVTITHEAFHLAVQAPCEQTD